MFQTRIVGSGCALTRKGKYIPNNPMLLIIDKNEGIYATKSDLVDLRTHLQEHACSRNRHPHQVLQQSHQKTQ
jgi:hypothetical protein